MIKPDYVTKNDIICCMSEKLLRSTGKRIRALRDDRGWNQTDFVDILKKNGTEIRRSTMSSIENDVNNPSVEVLITIAKTLGTTTDYLLVLSDDPFPQQSNDGNVVVEVESTEERKVIEEVFELIKDFPLEEQKNILDMLRFVVKDKKPRIVGGE